jgi:hypothetical protein
MAFRNCKMMTLVILVLTTIPKKRIEVVDHDKIKPDEWSNNRNRLDLFSDESKEKETIVVCALVARLSGIPCH